MKMQIVSTFHIYTTTGVKMAKNGVISPNASSMPGALIVETEDFSDETCKGLDQMAEMCIQSISKNIGEMISIGDLTIQLYNAIEKLIPNKRFQVYIGSYRIESDDKKE